MAPFAPRITPDLTPGQAPKTLYSQGFPRAKAWSCEPFGAPSRLSQKFVERTTVGSGWFYGYRYPVGLWLRRSSPNGTISCAAGQVAFCDPLFVVVCEKLAGKLGRTCGCPTGPKDLVPAQLFGEKRDHSGRRRGIFGNPPPTIRYHRARTRHLWSRRCFPSRSAQAPDEGEAPHLCERT